jgi:hypothetical protein
MKEINLRCLWLAQTTRLAQCAVVAAASLARPLVTGVRLALRSATGNQTPELTAGLLPWAAVAADNHRLGVQQ